MNSPAPDRRLAALLTCHNRREKTIACLTALHACPLPSGLRLTTFVVDDGSSDGTAEAITSQFPDVKVLRGDGSLFWNGGMRKAFAAAMEEGFDDYLWLNDDTLLDTEALQRLYDCRTDLEAGGEVSPLVVGATRDPVSGLLSYGGLIARDAASPNHLVVLPVGNAAQRCKSLNGNCVLVPEAAALALGNLDPNFVHAIGDWDYGMRANAAGFHVWMAPGFIGTCERNPPTKMPPALARSIRARLRHVCGPKQVPPRAWYTYVRRNYGRTWPIEFVKPYASAVLGALAAKWRGRGA